MAIAGRRSSQIMLPASCADLQMKQGGQETRMAAPGFEPIEAVTFAAGWIARNIEIGPYSWDDASDDERPISPFRTEAAQAGLSEADLERGLGPVPAFMAKAYAEADARWLADQRKRPPDDAASI
jgi:hypothetical protein